MLQFLEGDEIDVVCAVDGLGGAEDVVGDGDAATKLTAILNIVDEEGGSVEHSDYAGDDLKRVVRDVEEGVKGFDEGGADVLSWVCKKVVIRAHDDLFFLS